MTSAIDRVRNRKNHKGMLIDGINYGKVIAMQTYDHSWKAIIKETVRLFCFDYAHSIIGNMDSKKCLFYSLKSANRTDYDEIVSIFRRLNPEFYEVDIVQEKSLRYLFRKLYVLIKNWIAFRAGNVNDALLTALTTTQYMILYMKLEKIQIFNGIKMLVTFCDAYGPDNLITQVAVKQDIITATLQHGQYRILSPGNEMADAEAYENFISDYLLTWGQATIDEFARVAIDSKRMIKVGALKPFSFNVPIENNVEHKTFGVVLSGEPYRETNISMIKLANTICKKYALKFYLRMHPRNRVDYYLNYCDAEALDGYSNNIDNFEYASKVDFSLIHMTGVFVELLSINSVILVYNDRFLETIFRIEPYCVSDLSDFDRFYQSYLANKDEILRDQYGKYHYFNNVENSLEFNYLEAIKLIMAGELM